MIEVTGNLWEYPADIRVITTNGTVKSNGRVVMGRGCAREARNRFPLADYWLGQKILQSGNHVHWINETLLSFPVKHNWWEQADVELIERSARELVARDDAIDYDDLPRFTYVLPRPGCGNGGLKWTDVKPVIEPILDDRFHVITFGGRT